MYMRAVSELKDGIIHYDVSVSCKRILETQHQDQETTNQIQSTVIFKESQTPLNPHSIA